VLLPYPLDLAPEYLGKAIGWVIGWRPEGKRVTLAVDESGDKAIQGLKVAGTIRRVLEDVTTTGPSGSTPGGGPCALIELDQPLIYMGEHVLWVVSLPRFGGHGLYRLLVTWSVVNLHRAADTRIHELKWNDIIAIGLMRMGDHV